MPNGSGVRCTCVASVITGIGEPLTRAGIAVNAIECDTAAAVIGECDVPLFAVPDLGILRVAFGGRLFGPPVSRRVPRACRPQNLSLQLVTFCIRSQHRQLAGTPLCHLHANRARWAKN